MLEIEVVIKPFLGGRANIQFGLRPQAQHGSGQYMGAGMANTRQFIHLLPFLNGLALHLVFRALHGRWSSENQAIRRVGNPCDHFRLAFIDTPDTFAAMKKWISNYIAAEQKALASIPVDQVAEAIETVKAALENDRQIFVFGNGGSASNSSHFATDLGKGSSDAVGKRFKVLSLNDNVSWMTAIGNDYEYEGIYKRQLENYGQAGDVVLTMSVSGSSPNLVEACNWAKENGLHVIALIGGKRGKLSEIADNAIVVEETHYGRAEDCQMGIAHMICYAFMENPELMQ